jgi:hypothetical protein
LRSTIDENLTKIQGWHRTAMEKIFDGKATPREVLTGIGERLQKLVRAKIKSNVPPPNAPSTIKRKGSARTLIDTKLLLESINFKVLKK